jgi:hypothetical protein
MLLLRVLQESYFELFPSCLISVLVVTDICVNFASILGIRSAMSSTTSETLSESDPRSTMSSTTEFLSESETPATTVAPSRSMSYEGGDADTLKDSVQAKMSEPKAIITGTAGEEIFDSATRLTERTNVVDMVEDAMGSDNEGEYEIKDSIVNDTQYKSLAESLEVRKSKAPKRNLQAASYLMLIEDRLQEMDAKIKRLEAMEQKETEAIPFEEPIKPPEDKPKKQSLVAMPKTMTWKEFVAPSPTDREKPRHVLDVLVEPPQPLDSYATRDDKKGEVLANVDGPSAEDVHFETLVDSTNPGGNDQHHQAASSASYKVERIRINSPHINTLIREYLEPDRSPGLFETHLPPFKVLCKLDGPLRAKLVALESKGPYTDELSRENQKNSTVDTAPEQQSDTEQSRHISRNLVTKIVGCLPKRVKRSKVIYDAC